MVVARNISRKMFKLTCLLIYESQAFDYQLKNCLNYKSKCLSIFIKIQRTLKFLVSLHYCIHFSLILIENILNPTRKQNINFMLLGKSTL